MSPSAAAAACTPRSKGRRPQREGSRRGENLGDAPGPNFVLLAPDGYLVMPSLANNVVYSCEVSGRTVGSCAADSGGSAPFNRPLGLALNAGLLYVANLYGNNFNVCAYSLGVLLRLTQKKGARAAPHTVPARRALEGATRAAPSDAPLNLPPQLLHFRHLCGSNQRRLCQWLCVCDRRQRCLLVHAVGGGRF